MLPMMLPMRHQRHRIAAGRRGLDKRTVHLDVRPRLVGDAQSSVLLVEGVGAGVVQGVPVAGKGHPRRESALPAHGNWKLCMHVIKFKD